LPTASAKDQVRSESDAITCTVPGCNSNRSSQLQESRPGGHPPVFRCVILVTALRVGSRFTPVLVGVGRTCGATAARRRRHGLSNQRRWRDRGPLRRGIRGMASDRHALPARIADTRDAERRPNRLASSALVSAGWARFISIISFTRSGVSFAAGCRSPVIFRPRGTSRAKRSAAPPMRRCPGLQHAGLPQRCITSAAGGIEP
jgi:hypothetical protein